MLDLTWKSIADLAMNAEKYMDSLSGLNWFTTAYNILFAMGIALIVLKLIKKGAMTYIAWADGDPDSSPVQLAQNFVYALAIAIIFPWLYTIISDVTMEVMDDLLAALNISTGDNISGIFGDINVDSGLFHPVATLIHFIMLLLLYIQFIKRGLEMLILRLGIPIACTGLLDSNQGMFAPWMKKFFQSAATVVIQVCLGKLGVALAANNHYIWSYAALSTALGMPKFLQEFMIPAGGGGNVMGTVYHVTQLAQTVKRLIMAKG